MEAGGAHDRRTNVKTGFKNGKKIRAIHKLGEEQTGRMMRQKASGQAGPCPKKIKIDDRA